MFEGWMKWKTMTTLSHPKWHAGGLGNFISLPTSNLQGILPSTFADEEEGLKAIKERAQIRGGDMAGTDI